MSSYTINGARSSQGEPLELHIADGHLVAEMAPGAEVIGGHQAGRTTTNDGDLEWNSGRCCRQKNLAD